MLRVRSKIRLCQIRSSVFVKPELDTKKESSEEIRAVRGRENRKIMAPEYIAPQYQHPNSLWKRMVRQDCLRRRTQVDLPEFYPGSIIAITYSDKYAPKKTTRFVGRVLAVYGFGTNHRFQVRNIVDDVAVNIVFDLYSPLIQSLVVLKLEKWMDANLRYLMQCDPYFCKIPFDMMPDIIPPPDVPLERFTGKVPEKHEFSNEAGPPTGGAKNYNVTKRRFKRHIANPEAHWPPLENLFWEEHLIQEDITKAGYIKRGKSWRQFDIMRHHNYDHEHDDVMDEMKRHQKHIKHVTKTVGRPKIDYSKIEKIWIENYSVHSCQVIPEALRR